MTYLPTNKEFLGELRLLIAGYAEEDDDVLSKDAIELKQSLIKIIKQTSIVKQLESENARLRDELERLKSVVGEVDFNLIDECLKEQEGIK